MGKRASNRKIAEEVIRFLEAHMLDPTPPNYAFAFLYVTGINDLLRKLVDDVIDGGVRLTQPDVDDLMGQASGEPLSAPSGRLDELQQELREQARSFTDLTAAALRDTGAFNRDLSQGMEQLAAGFDLAGVLHAMVEKTAQMERKLAETRRETERLRQDLDAARDDASRDALTNLPNRRTMERCIEQAFRECGAVTIGFCDVDHFKAINDRHGHTVGDRVLKAVAETLMQELDPHVVARFGGEEFVVLFRGVSEATALTLVEKARLAVESRNFRVRDTDEPIGKVTFSAGIASSSTDPEQALADSDEALYEAKRSGRNRTVCKGMQIAA